jgi:hypothetical protein
MKKRPRDPPNSPSSIVEAADSMMAHANSGAHAVGAHVAEGHRSGFNRARNRPGIAEKLCPFSALNFRSHFTERSYAAPGTGRF